MKVDWLPTLLAASGLSSPLYNQACSCFTISVHNFIVDPPWPKWPFAMVLSGLSRTLAKVLHTFHTSLENDQKKLHCFRTEIVYNIDRVDEGEPIAALRLYLHIM